MNTKIATQTQTIDHILDTPIDPTQYTDPQALLDAVNSRLAADVLAVGTHFGYSDGRTYITRNGEKYSFSRCYLDDDESQIEAIIMVAGELGVPILAPLTTT